MWDKWGLVLNFAGGCILAASGLYGVDAGWGGGIVWNTSCWKWVQFLGWILLSLGFAFQFVGRWRE